MKKLILSILFLLFVFDAGGAYSFNYSKAKCTLIPLSHSLKLKMSADAYGIAKKYVPSNKDNGHFLAKSVFASHGIAYTVIVERRSFEPVNIVFFVFLFRNGDLIGTYSAAYYRSGLFTRSFYKRMHGKGLSPMVSFTPSFDVCSQFITGTNDAIVSNYTWAYYPTVPARVEKVTRYDGRKSEGRGYVYQHIQESKVRTYRLR